MKLLTIIFSLLLTAGINAATFSAFASGDELHVTILVDNCNSHSLGLEVNSFCKQDRLTKNLAPFCDVNIVIMSTKRFCAWSKMEPVTFTLSLAESNIASEARELTLHRYSGEELTIELDRATK